MTDRSSPRVESLDGVRALAATSVFVYHLLSLSPTVAEFDGPIEFEFYGRNLDVGVEIFFVLSGYLLSRSFFAAYFAGSRLPSLRTYARRRALRIYPAWIVFFVVALTADQFIEFIPRGDYIAPDDTWRVFQWVTLLHTWFFDPAHSSWTLTVEASFYLLLAVVMAALCRVARRARTEDPRRAAQLAIGVIVGLFAIGAGSEWYHLMFVGFDRFVPGALVALSLGMGLASAVERRAAVGRVVTISGARAASLAIGGGALFIGMSRFVSKSPYVVYGALPPPREQFAQTMWQAAVAALVVGAVVLAPPASLVHKAASWRPLVAFGTISYSFYLWHLLVLYLFDFINVTGPGHAWWMAAQAFAITTVISIVSYQLIERPALVWARKSRLAPRARTVSPHQESP